MTRPRIRQRIATLAAALVLTLTVAAPAVAAPQTRSIDLSYQGTATPNYTFDVAGYCDPCIPDSFGPVLGGGGAWAYGFKGTAVVDRLHWDATTSTAIGFDDSLLRQGQTLDVKDVLTPNGGTIVATGSITGSAGLLNRPPGATEFTDPDGTATAHGATWTFTGCAMPLPGDSPRTCSSNTQDIELGSQTIAGNLLGELRVKLSVRLHLVVEITSTGIVTARSVTFVGGSAGALNRDLTFVGSTPSTVNDPIALPCTQPAGSDITYGLGADDYNATHTTLAGRGALHAAAVITPLPILPGDLLDDIEVFGDDLNAIGATPLFGMGLILTGSAGSATLGTLGKNVIPPTPDAGGGSGHAYESPDFKQGTPIEFDGSASSSPCGFPTLRWDFSDGGVAFGAKPKHTFQGSGTYSGLLTATDVTGLTATQTFSILIHNLAPVVDAGIDTTAAWGRSVAFNGQAVDPGKDDQDTLGYWWRFGDGTPDATGSGPSVTHAYALPGTYTAMLTVCDRNGACDFDTRAIAVRTRNVSVGTIGDTAATYDTGAHLRASLVDEFGQTVNGRTVAFSVAGGSIGSAGSAVTNSSGVGSTAWTPSLAAGTYTIAAGFAGDSLYAAASGSGTVAIARKATTLAYTGTLTGGANKTITLSAVLVDATATPLAGRSIAFKLGTQTASAVTSASGVASVQLKLAQKNGTYPLTATWTPASPDDGRYLPSAASATFKLQAK